MSAVAPTAARLPPRTSGGLPHSGSALGLALLGLLVFWLQFGPMIGLVGFRLYPHVYWTLLGGVRDGLTLALVAAAAFSVFTSPRSPWPACVRWAVLWLAILALAALVSAAHPLVALLNLRRMALVPALFVALWLLPWSTRQIERLFAWIVGSSLVVALLGIVGWVAPTPIWDKLLDITSYTDASGFDRFKGTEFEDGGRYFTADLAFAGVERLPRAIASYLEPTTLAAGMAAASVVLLARRARGHRAGISLLLIATCGVLTLSKGYWVFAVALCLWRLLGWPGPQHLLGLVLAAGVAGLLAAELDIVHSTFAHLDGYASGLRYLWQGKPWGEGLGAAGNYTEAGFDQGGESGLGNAITQLGWAGLLPLAWLLALQRDLLQRARLSADPGGPWLACWGVFWVVTFLFSASSQGVGGNALGFIVMALYLHPAMHAPPRSDLEPAR